MVSHPSHLNNLFFKFIPMQNNFHKVFSIHTYIHMIITYDYLIYHIYN
ncbi:hypothetical protein DCAR_0730060 [Daucus carota subsp. sativus]|uniref:Uncharacterized protein n=1 Tax=Daucus carota subsp. sativus TaxID=79200 RepID=A0AAF0XQ75_DAUCS|nr:hypothetical protein DCAR_0730060 [Daucus carota subsp. sativus]